MASVQKRETAKGDRWDVTWRVNGVRHTRTFSRLGAARAHSTKVDGDRMTGLAVDPRGAEELFQGYAERWLASRLVRGRPLADTTRDGYHGLLRRNINPHLGQRRLRQISVETVREWYSLVVDDAGGDQAAKSYRLLRGIMTTAVEDGRIGRNPCVLKGAGTEQPRERPLVDAGIVLALAEAIGPSLRAFVLVAGFGALRTGEQLGLRRRDLDLLHGEVHVDLNAVNVIGKGRVVKDPKSVAGQRIVVVPRVVVDALTEHLESFGQPGPDGFVFTSPRGFAMTRREVSQRWRAAVAAVPAAPPGLHPHDLRHYGATLAARTPGITLKELMARIGHSSVPAALRYQHATRDRDRVVASFLDDQIANAPKPNVVNLRD